MCGGKEAHGIHSTGPFLENLSSAGAEEEATSCDEFLPRPDGWTRPQTDAEEEGTLTSSSKVLSAELKNP